VTEIVGLLMRADIVDNCCFANVVEDEFLVLGVEVLDELFYISVADSVDPGGLRVDIVVFHVQLVVLVWKSEEFLGVEHELLLLDVVVG
jgi:hypothetical protein